jgi:hypothetical protein
MGSRGPALGDQLGANDRHLPRRLDPQSNLAGLQPDHCDADVFPDE